VQDPPESAVVLPRTTLFRSLAVANYRRLWLGFAVSHTGDAVQMLAQSWLVVTLTGSATHVGAVALCQAIPRLVLALGSGVVVDRFDRRKLLLIGQSVAMLQATIFFALVVTHTITYEAILLLAFGLGLVDMINITARQAMIPTLVPREVLPNALALVALAVNLTQIAASAIGGVMLATLDVEGCLGFNALSFAVLLVSVWRLPPCPPPAHANTSAMAQLREGVDWIVARRPLLATIALTYGVGLVAMPYSRLLPYFARTELGTDGPGYAWLATASGIGALTASTGLAWLAKERIVARVQAIAALVIAVSLVALSLQTTWIGTYVVLVVLGGAGMAARTSAVPLVQSAATDDVRGRVMSAMSLDFGLWALGAVGMGVVGDVLGIRQSFGGAGLLVIVALLLAAPISLRWRPVRAG